MIPLSMIVLSRDAFFLCCSLMEACLLSLSRSDARIAEHRPTASAIWRKLKSNIQKPLSAVLVAVNTLANVVGAFFAGFQANRVFGGKWNFAFSLVFSYMLIQWCEESVRKLSVPPGTMFALCQGNESVQVGLLSGCLAGRRHRAGTSLAAGCFHQL